MESVMIGKLVGGGAAVTVIGAVPWPFALVPLTVTVCAVAGAVKSPAAVIVPAEALHVTD